MLKISLLTIGDEICIGQVLNTNAQWLSQQLSNFGCNIVTHSVIEDDKGLIMSEITRLRAISNIIILTGGLGPTHDDITKSALLEYFNDRLVMHEQTLMFIERLYESRGIKPSDRIKSQALVPAHCIPLKNQVGTAPGMLFEIEGTYIFSLPGVPTEMRYLYTNHIIPFLNGIFKERRPKVVVHKTLNIAGISESVLADLLGDPKMYMPSGKLAFLPSFKGVRLRISMPAENPQLARKRIDEARKVIYGKVGKYIISEDDTPIAVTLAEFLTKINKTVSVAESCTGGMLGAEFSSIPGSSKFFNGGVIAYNNDIKEKLLVIDRQLIEKYGAVSEEVCKEMAKNIRNIFKSDIGISITGIAGPDGGSPDKPVGTVFIGLADKNEVKVEKFFFSNERTINRERSVAAAQFKLFSYIVDNVSLVDKRKK